MQSESRLFTFFLASVSALTSLSIDMSLPAVPGIERAFALPASHGSLTLSLFLAGYAVTPLAGGPLADRYGRRPVLLAGLLLFAVAALACTVAPSFFLLLACRLLQGCASGVCVALPLAIIRDSQQGHSARQSIAEVTTINGVMPLLAPLLGAWVMRLGRGRPGVRGGLLHLDSWRIIFAVQALFAAFVLLTVLLYFKESLPSERRQGLHPAMLARNYRLLFTHRLFFGYSLLYALNFAGIFAFISASPLILMQRMGISRSTYTLFFALTASGTIAGSVVSGLLSRRSIQVRRVLTTGLLVMVAAAALAALLQIAGLQFPLAILPLVFVTLFCFGLTSPAITLEALEPVPQLAGAGSGAMRSLQMIFGSGASGFLAVFCARPWVNPAIATTLTMTAAILASLTLYFAFLRGQRA